MPIFSRKLTDAEKEILSKYKRNDPITHGGNGFAYQLNDYLNKNEQISWVKECTKILDEIFKSSFFSKDTEVFRASSPIDDFCSDNIFSCKQYLSTARTLEATWQHFPRINNNKASLLKIYCPKGSFAIDMEANNYGGTEHEILLPREINFIIENIQIIDDKSEISNCITAFNYPTHIELLKIYELSLKLS